MSTHYKAPQDVPTDVLIVRLSELSAAVADGRLHEFTMRIPAEVDRDADIVLREAARRLAKEAA